MFGQVLIYALILATQVLFIALALHAVRLVSRVINLALGGIATAGAYTFYFAFTQQGWSVVWSAIFTILVLSVLGALNYYINERPTRKNQHLLALLASFGLGLGLEAIIALIFGTASKSFSVGIASSFNFGEYQVPFSGVAIIIGGLIIAISAILAYQFTPIGRTLRAISENNFSAMSLGINQSRFRITAYILAALVAGSIGALSGLYTAITPTMGFNLLVLGFIALLVGGVNDLKGTILAAYFVVVIPQLVVGLVPSVSANWQMLIVFVIASILLVLRPAGLFSPKQRLI